MTSEKQRSKRKRVRMETVGRRVDRVVDRAASRLERETERLITYLNEQVVPAVREHSTRGLRKAAEKLARFADYLDSSRQR